jgi:hypothetical protein
MTDDPFTTDGGLDADRADDELVSAYLDDEVTPEERALVEGDARRRARVEELSEARDAVRAVTPLPPERREQMLAAVLQRLDQPVAPVVPARRRRAGFDATKGLAVAAAVVMIGLLGFALALADQEDDGDADSAATREEAAVTLDADDSGGGEGGDSAGDSAATDGEMRDDRGSADAAPPDRYLGEFASTQDLQEATRAAASAFTESRPTAADVDDAAATESDACTVTGGTRLRATLEGTPVFVDVPDDPAADIILRDAATCERITSFPR